MKPVNIDMSPEAVTLRLKQAGELRRACLLLADSSAGKKIREQFAANDLVKRTSEALGRPQSPPGRKSETDCP